MTEGRVMLQRLRFLARTRRDFAFETTLAGLGHERWLQQLHAWIAWAELEKQR